MCGLLEASPSKEVAARSPSAARAAASEKEAAASASAAEAAAKGGWLALKLTCHSATFYESK